MGINEQLFRCIKDGECLALDMPWHNPIEPIIKWSRTKAGELAICGDIENSKARISCKWADLVKDIIAAAAFLKSLKLNRVAILTGPHPTAVKALFALLLVDSHFTIMDPLATFFTHKWYKLENFKPEAIIIPSLEEMPNNLLDKLEEIKGHYSRLTILSFGKNPLADIDLTSYNYGPRICRSLLEEKYDWFLPKVIIYSSGRYHQWPTGYAFYPYSLFANALAVAERFKITGKTRFLLSAQIDSCDGLIPIISTLLKGGKVFLHSNLRANMFWDKVNAFSPSLVRTTSSIIDELITFESRFCVSDKSALKYIIVGSGFLPKLLGLRFLDTFDIPLIQAYGTTATGGYVYAMEVGRSRQFYETALKDNIVGNELSYCNTRLDSTDIEGILPEPPSEFGRVFVRGKSVSCGWWDGNKVINWQEEWIATSDVVSKTQIQDKTLYKLYGRIEDSLCIDGKLIWPMYIEQVLTNAFDFLAECIIITVPAKKRNKEKLIAVVSFKPDVPEYQYKEYLIVMQTRLNNGGVVGLDDQFIPSELIIVDYKDIPRTHDGKPDREKLKKHLLESPKTRRMRA